MKINNFFKNILNIKSNYFIFFVLFTIIFSETIILNTSLIYFFFIGLFIFINLHKIKFTLIEIFSLALFLIYLLVILNIAQNKLILLSNIKFYFGFILFLIFFKVYKIDFSYVKTLKILFLLSIFYTFLDALIINFTNLNFHQEEHTARFFGFFLRPPGNFGNSTISSIFLSFCYLILIKDFKVKFKFYEKILFYLSIVMLFSTTGFITLFLTLLILNFQCRNETRYIILILFGIFLIVFIYLSTTINPDIAQKISIKYLLYVLDEKIFYIKNIIFGKELILNSFNDLNLIFKFSNSLFIDDCSYYFGCQIIYDRSSTSGDMGFLNTWEIIGIFGCLIYLLVAVSFMNFKKVNFLYLFLIIFMSLHYGFIFSNFGQLLFSMILLNKFNFEKKVFKL